MKRPLKLLGMLAAAAMPLVGLGDGDGAAVAISTRASSDYVRPQLPDGAFQAETFVFGKGGVWAGVAKDPTIDKMDFMEVARTVASPLARQGYISGRDPKATKLLIMVYWGTTHAPEHATDSIASQNLQVANEAALAENRAQVAHFNPADSMAPTQMSQSSATSYAIRSPDQIDADNAMTGAMAAVSAEDRAREQDDFHLMWKEKKAKLLWEARYSIRTRGNDFGKQLAAMTQEASKYFGQNSGGIVRKALPAGHVEIGEQKVLDYGSAK